MAAEVAQVARRCEEAKASRELILDSCGLRKFPDAVFFLLSGVEVQKLSLADNQFPRIPKKITSSPVFASIATLNLSCNKISTLPDTLPSLQKLSFIILSGNKFESFPEILLQIHSLVQINLSSNRIQSVGQSVVDSLGESVKELNLTDNPLTQEAKAMLQSSSRIVC